MQLKYGFVSVDDHVQETPNLWIDRLRNKFGDRVPHLITAKDGSEQWFVDGQMTIADIAVLAYTRFADEGGFDITPRRNVTNWISRCEAELGIARH